MAASWGMRIPLYTVTRVAYGFDGVTTIFLMVTMLTYGFVSVDGVPLYTVTMVA